MKLLKFNSNFNVISFINIFIQYINSFFFKSFYYMLLNLRFFLLIFFFKIILNSFNLNYIYVYLYSFNVFVQTLLSKFYYKYVLFNHLFYLTNLDIFLILNFILIFFYIFVNIYFSKIIPNTSQAKVEFIYNFIAQMGFAHNGWKGQRYFAFFFVLFLFILVSNFLGMIPYSFTVTSHIFQTFALGCGMILSITILGISRKGLKWFLLFFPNLPIFILPLFTCIEIVSYISRAFSLAIRLFANLMSGHTLLNILTGFILKIGSQNFFNFLIALIPFLLISAIILLEMIIAILQAYVFVTLVTIYLKDSFGVSH